MKIDNLVFNPKFDNRKLSLKDYASLPKYIKIKKQKSKGISNKFQTESDEENNNDSSSKYKKEKSLGILCQQFIGLFVSWKRVISLEEAAR